MDKFIVTMIGGTHAIKFEFPSLEKTLGFIADYEEKFPDRLSEFQQALIVKEATE